MNRKDQEMVESVIKVGVLIFLRTVSVLAETGQDQDKTRLNFPDCIEVEHRVIDDGK